MDREDFDRPLNKRGKRDAPRMAKHLLESGLCPDVIVSSPARRARKTAEAVNRVCTEAVLKFDNKLYPGSAEDYVDVLTSLDENLVCAMLVGHNPGLEDWLRTLGVECERFPTAALAHLELKIETWRDLNLNSRATSHGVWFPREL